MLIIEIALGIVLGFVILQHLNIFTTSLLVIMAIIAVSVILYFLYDSLTSPYRKRKCEEAWNEFNRRQEAKEKK